MKKLFSPLMLRQIVILAAILTFCPFCFSMEAPRQDASSAFGHMKVRLLEELTAYESYIEDACDYYTSLVNNFSSVGSVQRKNLRLKEKLALKGLDKISIYDKDFVLTEYEKMKKAENDPLQAFVIWCSTIQLIFMEKQKTIKCLLPGLQKTLDMLDHNNVDTIFLSLLTTHGVYLKSRSDTLRTDPSPAFSIPGAHDNFHDQRKIAIEETKHGIVIDFLEFLYPFIKDTDRRINKLLLYFPVLSKHLSAPQNNFLLDEFALDGFIFGKYNREEDVKNVLSGDEVDRNFMRATSIPIIDIYSLQNIQDPTFAAEKIEWISLYRNQFEKVLAPKIVPENYLKGLETLPKKKKKKKRQSRKKNNRLVSREDVQLKQQWEETTILHSDKEIAPKETSSEQTPATSFPSPQMIIEELPDKSQNQQEPLSLEHTLVVSPKEPSSIVIHEQSIPAKEIEAADQKEIEVDLKDDFARRKEELRRRAKIERDFRKERKGKLLEVIEQPLANELHSLLPGNTRFKIKKEDYNLLTSLLKGRLPPTTSYNKFTHSLKRLGVIFLSRGNGDKRTMLMPNGRKELVFHPATSEVGHRFIEKVRKALQEKWGLKEEYLY